jgi:hypothetical protein
MDDDSLTAKLATEILGWQAAPGRFLKPGRSWIPKWRFAPLSRLEDAFKLLDHSGCTYKLERNGENLSVEVH